MAVKKKAAKKKTRSTRSRSTASKRDYEEDDLQNEQAEEDEFEAGLSSEDEAEDESPPRKKATRKKASSRSKSSSRSSASEAPASAPSVEGLAGKVRSLEEPKRGGTVCSWVELPGGVLMQWGRSSAPMSGSTSDVEFERSFGGIPVVTGSYLWGHPSSATERYLMDVDEDGFTWRCYTHHGEFMWLAVGPAESE